MREVGTAEMHLLAADARGLTQILRARAFAFRAVLVAAILGLALVCLRNVLLHRVVPVADLLCLAAFVLVLAFFQSKPDRLQLLAWIAFAALSLNLIEGLDALGDSVITSTHVMLPCLVMYGALLGDLLLTLAALGIVLAIYAVSALYHWPLERMEIHILSNLSISSLVLGAVAFVVWRQQVRFQQELHLQAEALRSELEINKGLISLVTHDIASPLTVIAGAAENLKGGGNGEDLSAIQGMTCRIGGIIKSLRGLQSPEGTALQLEGVSVKQLAEELEVLFCERLKAKGQRLVLLHGGELVVSGNFDILCHSVLGNFASNAMKFSPRDAVIEFAAARYGSQEVRIELRDAGSGLDEAALRSLREVGQISSRPGTEGEQGSGAGLRIATLCAQRMGGRLDFSRRPGGGLIASVILPAAGGVASKAPSYQRMA